MKTTSQMWESTLHAEIINWLTGKIISHNSFRHQCSNSQRFHLFKCEHVVCVCVYSNSENLIGFASAKLANRSNTSGSLHIHRRHSSNFSLQKAIAVMAVMTKPHLFYCKTWSSAALPEQPVLSMQLHLGLCLGSIRSWKCPTLS